MGTKLEDPLVSVEWLSTHRDAPDIRILDATWFLPTEQKDPKAHYLAKHIPDAIFFDVDEICDLENPLPHMLPSPEKFAARVRKMGIGDGARIVVYDAKGVYSAARVWWMFRAMGHEDVVVLDGGLPAWEAAGLPLDEGPAPPRQERHFTPRFRSDLVRSLADVRKVQTDGSAVIVDTRSADRFRGEATEPRDGVRSGHIPGARNLPWESLLTSAGLMKSAEEIENLLAQSAIDQKTRIVAMCGSGVTAAIFALALARTGRWEAPVYDGSWAEWGADPSLPLATGSAR